MYPEMEDKLLALMDEFHLLNPARDRWQVLIQSFSETSLRQIDSAAPELPLVQLVSGSATSGEVRAGAAEVATYAEGLGPSHSDVDAGVIEGAHQSCLAVHPYTVNDVDDTVRLIEIGVDGMFTNFPDKLNDVLGDRAVHGKRAAVLAKRAHDVCVA
nr:glycerophosphodiester phosphodiesterase family protein [Solicola gregarius]